MNKLQRNRAVGGNGRAATIPPAQQRAERIPNASGNLLTAPNKLLQLSRHLLALTLIAVATGCADMSAVRRFSDASLEATDRLPLFANDIVDASRRTHSYTTVTNAPDLAAQTKAREDLLRVHQVLDLYLRSLGAIASSEKIDFSRDVQLAGDELGKLSVGDDRTRAAGQELATTLLKIIADGYRSRQVAKVIEACDVPVTRVSEGLAKSLRGGYLRILQAESDQLDSFVEDQIDPQKEKEPLAYDLAMKDITRLREDLARRRALSQETADALDALRQQHNVLYGSARHLNADTLIHSVLKYEQEIKSLRQKFKEL